MNKPINLRLPETLDQRVDKAANKTGLPKADIIRTALAAGIRDLELINYDIEGAIHDRIQSVKFQNISKVAETPTPYKTKKNP